MCLESLGLQTEGQRSKVCVGTVGSHVHLEHLRHIVPVDAHVGEVVTQHGFSLEAEGGIKQGQTDKHLEKCDQRRLLLTAV